jgi:hypothetical protein
MRCENKPASEKPLERLSGREKATRLVFAGAVAAWSIWMLAGGCLWLWNLTELDRETARYVFGFTGVTLEEEDRRGVPRSVSKSYADMEVVARLNLAGTEEEGAVDDGGRDRFGAAEERMVRRQLHALQDYELRRDLKKVLACRYFGIVSIAGLLLAVVLAIADAVLTWVRPTRRLLNYSCGIVVLFVFADYWIAGLVTTDWDSLLGEAGQKHLPGILWCGVSVAIGVLVLSDAVKYWEKRARRREARRHPEAPQVPDTHADPRSIRRRSMEHQTKPDVKTAKEPLSAVAITVRSALGATIALLSIWALVGGSLWVMRDTEEDGEFRQAVYRFTGTTAEEGDLQGVAESRFESYAAPIARLAKRADNLDRYMSESEHSDARRHYRDKLAKVRKGLLKVRAVRYFGLAAIAVLLIAALLAMLDVLLAFRSSGRRLLRHSCGLLVLLLIADSVILSLVAADSDFTGESKYAGPPGILWTAALVAVAAMILDKPLRRGAELVFKPDDLTASPEVCSEPAIEASTSRQILDARLARGEITLEEHESICSAIGDQSIQKPKLTEDQ